MFSIFPQKNFDFADIRIKWSSGGRSSEEGRCLSRILSTFPCSSYDHQHHHRRPYRNRRCASIHLSSILTVCTVCCAPFKMSNQRFDSFDHGLTFAHPGSTIASALLRHITPSLTPDCHLKGLTFRIYGFWDFWSKMTMGDWDPKRSFLNFLLKPN